MLFAARMAHLGAGPPRLAGDLHGVLRRGGKAVKDGRLVRKDAVVGVRNVFQDKCKVHWEVPDKIIARPAGLIQLWQACL